MVLWTPNYLFFFFDGGLAGTKVGREIPRATLNLK
jgi:hypothetical protein